MFRTLAPRIAQKIGTVALAFVLVASGLLMTTASPAEARPSCHNPGPRWNGEGAGFLAKDVNLRAAPYAHCAAVRRLLKGELFYYHCWYQNDYDNWWVYGRLAGTSVYGWVFLENLYDLDYDDDGDGREELAICGYDV